MRTRSLLVYGIGLLLLSLVFVVSIPLYSQRIPQSLQAHVEQKMRTQGIDWVQVEAQGRDIILKGNAPNPQAYQQALKLPKTVGAVRHIHNHLQHRLISPYTLRLDWSDGKLRLDGYLPNQDSYQKLSKQLGKLYGEANSYTELQLATGSPKAWAELVEHLVVQLRSFERAHVELTDQKLHISGKTAASELREQLQKSLEPFSTKGYELDLHIIALDEAAQRCQERFNQLLKTPISFESGKATISKSSYTLLESLAETAMFCPKSYITITGHTDNQGDIQDNLKLSQQRAKAVAAWLFQNGIDPERIRTIGYGSRRPLASNNNAAGRAKNRRIEFTVQGR